MSQIYNIYCDESCHLEKDKQKAMVLGGIWCAKDEAKKISIRIKEIKEKYKINRYQEIKWTKISKSKIDFYLNLVDYFFDDDDLNFRCLVVPDKEKLDHENFSQNHDQWYYKMYFDMLKIILDPKNTYKIYLDIKDTKGGDKVKKLQEVLCNNIYDFDRKIIEQIQIIRSHEVEIIQLTDLLIGAVSYINRGLETSEAKKQIVERIKERTGFTLTRSTLYRENKFNIFIWKASQKIC
ncbi:MAG: DUF3800 domain-containing protein [bacterium]